MAITSPFDNYGILIGTDWNSNQWKALPTEQDLAQTNMENVKENGIMNTFTNFGHEIFPTDEFGYYWGMLPHQMTTKSDKDRIKDVKVALVRSVNWEDGQNYIVGIYAFAEFTKGRKTSPIPEIEGRLEMNVRSLPSNIHLVKNFVNLTTHTNMAKLLPAGKLTPKKNYSYMKKENVLRILDELTTLNPDDTKLKSIKLKILRSV
jgi:5-methylcytosine-specific restriction protein A